MTANKDLTSISATLFPSLELGDIRRNRRFSQVAEALADKLDFSLPEVFPNPSHGWKHTQARSFCCMMATVWIFRDIRRLNTISVR